MSFSAWRAAFDELRRGRVTELVYVPERARLWRIAEKLDTVQLHSLADDSEPLSPDELVGEPEGRSGHLMLGHYSQRGLVYALEQYGLWQAFARFCKQAPVLSISGTGESSQVMSVRDGEGGPVLVELKAGLRFNREVKTEADQPLPGPMDRAWLELEWLTLQNPYGEFSAGRPPLPGQQHPGLGVGREVMDVLLIMGWRLGVAGLVAHPAWFHNAVFYRLQYRFVDPEEEGRFLALRRDWRDSGLTLGEASWAIEGGKVRDEAEEVVVWTPGPLAAPLVPEADFETLPSWADRVEAAKADASFTFPAREKLRAPPP